MASAAPPIASLLSCKLPNNLSRSPPRRWQLYRCHRRSIVSCCLAVDRRDEEGFSAAPTVSGSELRVAFTGGGTGGHVFPAIAIADELRLARPDASVLFVGTHAGMERDAVPSAGYNFASVPATRLSRPLLSPENLLLPFRLLQSVFASWKILREFRPNVVVGTGGYVSAPVCFAAVLSGIKVVIQEQNCIPGLVNRLLGPYAEKIFLPFEACRPYFPKEKCVVYGNPIRLSLRRYISKAVARSHFFPKVGWKDGDECTHMVLVLGGSTGAHAINIAVLNMYYDMLMEHKNRFIIWQTGANGYDEMESLVKSHRRLLLTPFLQAMDLAYAAADVIVSRAGAMTCSEILATGKPSILIPLPCATDDHQAKNAYLMADIAGSRVLPEDELDSSSLEITINELLGDDNVMAEMSQKAMSSAQPNASTDIVQSIISLVKLSSP